MPRNLPVLTALILFTATVMPAQVAPVPTGAGNVVTLTPFEVAESQDKGYASQDTLSGSRLRTNLRDIAAAISPMTAEFLRDIAATNVETAMEYAIGARVETDDARAAGPVGDGYNDSVRSIRVRGLPGAGRSLNFFGAPGELDTYMMDRIELSRGPNSILYGFGSPAGRINVASKQAQTNRDSYSVTHRIDDWDGQRWSFDANVVPIKDRLALRLNGLRGREGTWRAAGYNDQDRVFLAAKWQVDRRTTVKAEYEQGKIARFVPRPFFANDLSSTWVDAGRPSFNNFSATYVPGTAGTGATGTPGTPIRNSGATAVNGILERSGGDWVVVSDRLPYAQNYRQFTTSNYPSGSLLANDFALGRSNPRAVPEANWVRGNFDVKFGSVYFQRELLRDLNVELAFNRQLSRTVTRNLASWNYYGVAADPNRYLPNGQLKPADMQYYFDVSPDYRPSSSRVNQGRVTLSYERRVRDLVTLRLAGLGELAATDARSEIFQQYWLKGPSLTSGGVFNATPENGANTVYYRNYLRDLAVLNDPNFRIPAPYDLSAPVKYQDPATGTVRDIYMRQFNRSQGNIGYVDRRTGAWMGVAQAYFLKDRLVGTFGYRKDRLKNWVGVAFRDPEAERVAPNTGVWTPADPSTAKPTTFNGQTRTVGAVAHLLPWFSVFANASNSVSTPGTNYITPADVKKTGLADLVPSPSGKTNDHGVKLSLLKNRLSLTATRFHTISLKEFGFSGFNKGNIVNIWNALGNSTALPADETAFALAQAQVMNMVQGYTQNSESRGTEIEIVGQVTSGWSLSVNFAQNKSTRTNMAPEYRAYIDHWKPYWLKYRDLSITQNINQPRPQRAPGFQDWNTPAVIAGTGDFTLNTDSVNEAIADAESAFFDNPHVFEGKRFVGDPLYTVNLRTRYDFREGFLKGFSVGGGTRWRVNRIAGARTDYSVAPGSDFTDKWNGRTIDRVTLVSAKDQNVYDLQFGYSRQVFSRKVRWSAQLNINNVLNQRELIVNNIHPRTLSPLTFRYQDPRQFVLTNTFGF
ncbi:MAG: TonB-dependent receptor plug domain-containing protein [Opitutaceae bacterium]